MIDSNALFALPPSLVYLVGFVAPFGPFVAAFTLTLLTGGTGAMRRLAARGLDLRFDKRWLLAAVLFFPCWAGAALLLGIATAGGAIDLPWLSDPASLLLPPGIANLGYMLVFVGVAEEFGWRGYALDKLQAHHDAMTSSVILGAVWWLWHLPLFLIAGAPQQSAGPLSFLIQMIFFSSLFTWLYNNTGGSLLVAILFHAMMDWTLLVVFPVASIFAPGSLPVICLYVSGAVILLAVIVAWGPRRLVRSPREAPGSKARGPSR